ncbi:FAD-dependent monooxygenase [Flavobacterium sp.]|uniref:FAD-dependent monooxygenase n=1 Tax=Flavobacterium sp. TaxID=239 RepID=UPI0037C0FEBE
MEKLENSFASWSVCQNCKGQGKKNRRQAKKSLIQHEKVATKNEQIVCKSCLGSGILPTVNFPQVDNENYPHVSIIGAGIGGVALAVACLHRGIPFTLYERDKSFADRSQGYGLTLQQASKAIKGFGLFSLKEAIVSTKHIVHTSDGKIIGEWGLRKWLPSDTKKQAKHSNFHISRQALRSALLNQLDENNKVQWGHQLVDFKESNTNKIDLSFQVNGKIKNVQTNILVGADGIRSSVRKLLLGEEIAPLRYLDCMVILGICILSALENTQSPLLDGATVFQTANGKERIYMMPYSKEAIMWQLSFPISEEAAKEISKKGKNSLKEEAILRTNWHTPIPEIIKATLESEISGYPVYDREIVTTELLKTGKNITLIGDAAHPMSPFKGQGANQALLDALSLAREITKKCTKSSNWREIGIRKSVLNDFESDMLSRSATKVKDSAEAAKFLHTEIALFEGNEPRGSVFKKIDL